MCVYIYIHTYKYASANPKQGLEEPKKGYCLADSESSYIDCNLKFSTKSWNLVRAAVYGVSMINLLLLLK